MDKNEFLTELRLSLNGRVDVREINESIDYYENYINTRVRMGQTEESVLASLGDPRLIAKTITQTKGKKEEQETYRENTYNYKETKEETYNNPYSSFFGANNLFVEKESDGDVKRFLKKVARKTKSGFDKLPDLAKKIIKYACIIGIVIIIFEVLSFLLPIVVPVILIIWIIKLFRRLN